MALNFPANLCHDDRLVQLLLDAIRKYECSPSQIVVEVTETHLMNYQNEARSRLDTLAKYGIGIAIDDFGTGYSSMQYLASLPCHALKIDRDFFLKLEENNKNNKIIEAITALAHSLNLTVVAEGIEHEHLLNKAKEFGCDHVQGYWLGAPVFASPVFTEFLQNSRKTGRDLVLKSKS